MHQDISSSSRIRLLKIGEQAGVGLSFAISKVGGSTLNVLVGLSFRQSAIHDASVVCISLSVFGLYRQP
jgi:hypothetical protein